MRPEISIIVPVYNSSKYLKKCVDSILSQSFTDFELVLVNDGSTDESGNICNAYKDIDSRVRVFHQNNKGAGSARNTGINLAVGDYLMFCDSDDVTGKDWILHLLEKAGDLILPIGSHCPDEDHLGKRKDLGLKKSVYPKCDYWQFNKVGIAGYLGNALYDRSIVIDNSITFRETKDDGNYNEDLIFTLNYVKHIKKIIYTGYSDYAYIKRENSLSVSYPKYYFKKYTEKYLLWKDFLNENDIFDQYLYSNTLYRLLSGLNNIVDGSKMNDRKAYDDFKCAVESEIFKELLLYSDTNSENKYVISCLREKKARNIWIYLHLSKIKRRLLV